MVNPTLLGKGLKKLGILIFLFIASPILLSMAFKAVRIYTEGTPLILSYLFLTFAGGMMLFAIVYAFKAFKTILKAIFDS